MSLFILFVCFDMFVSDWRLYPEDPVHAARPFDHIPPQPATR